MSKDERQVGWESVVDEGGTILGQRASETLLSGNPGAWSGRVIARSGAMEGEEPERAALRMWGGEGVAALDAGIERWLGARAGDGRLCVWPNAADVVSDLPSCLSMLRRWGGRGVEAVCDPAAMMTAAMTRVGDDFVLRVMETLAEHPSVAMVVIGNGLSEKQARVVRELASAGGKGIVALSSKGGEERAHHRGTEKQREERGRK